MVTTTPPGWYDDGHGAMRWWDGSRWTEHVAQPDPEPDADAPTEAEIVAANAEQSSHAAQPEPATVGPSFGSSQPDGAAPYAQPQPEQPAPGYPAPGYPAAGQPAYGDPAHAGGFTAATGPRTGSKLWILWLVLGIVLLGIVIAAVVLIPILLMGAATSGAQGDSDDERAAVAAVELYDDAWQDADCDAYESSTTEDFRVSFGLTDCDDFVAEAEYFDESADDYEIRIDDVTTSGDTITVSTTETYLALLDDVGDPLDQPEYGSVEYIYTLVAFDGGWAIDSID